ncbi:MAG TPA: low affinity iron permease family protein [Sphingobium sp.]
MDRFFAAFSHRVASWAGQPASFMVAFLVVIVWGCTGPLFHYSDTWQLVINTGTTIVTFLMVFLIQNAQNRDASAMQAKLDELIRASKSARNDFIGIEHFTEAQLESIRAELEKLCDGDDEAKHAKLLLDRVIQRR